MKAATRTLLKLAACAAVLAGSATASAQGSAAAAEALFEQGRQDMAAGNFDAACEKFRQSDKLDPEAVGTRFNLADCEEQRGNFATAWELFKAVEGKVPEGDERHAIAKARRESVEPRVPKVTFELAAGAPPGTAVRMGDVELAASTFGVPLPLDPGQHELVVVAPGHAERRIPVTLEVGQVLRVAVAPGDPLSTVTEPAPTAATAAPAAATEPSPADEGARPASGKTLGYALGGVGVAGLVVGGVTGAMVLGKKSIADEHCYPELQRCDQEGIDANDAGRTLGVVSTTGFVVGVLGLGLGTYFILTSDERGEPATALVTRVSPGATELSLVRRW